MPTVTYNWASTGGSFFVNDAFTTGNQAAPAIAAINNGTSYFSSWDTGDGAIYGRRIENDGDPAGSDFLVNQTVANVQIDSSVAQLTGGSIIVTYTDYSVDPGGDLRARILSSTGTPGAEIVINNLTSDDTDSDVASLADGGFVVSWTRDFGAGDLDVRAAIFNADGSVRTSLVSVDSATDSASRSQVAGLANGNFVVVYEREPAVGGDTEVVFRIFNSTGSSVVAATVIDTIGSINEDIQVVALQDGGFAVAYTDNGWGLDQTEITLRFYNSDGSPRTFYIRPNSTTTGVQDGPSLTVLSNGYVVVGWVSGTTLTYQAYTPDGVAVGNNFGAAGSIVSAEIAGLTGGLMANVRESTISDGDGNSIRSSIEELTRTTAGDGTNEVLVGDSLRDTITGAGGNDILTGGLNTDTLTGGAGSDIFRDTAAGLNGDTIVDFSRFDRIHVTDATLAGFTFGYGGGTLAYTGGSLATGITNEYRVVARAAEGGGVEMLLANSEYDFNGDGRGDLAWRHADGSFTTWLGQPNGSMTPNPGSGANPLGLDWQIRGIGDFNGDGRDDILWRQAGGEIGQWLGQSNGIFANNGGAAANAVDNSWTIAGIADFNGDGRDDILWRHTSGEVGEWIGLPSGGFANNGGAAANAVDPSWTVMTTGDFNGDGFADVLWRHSSGVYAEWQGTATGALVNAGGVTIGGGTVVGSGDFNGDGREDVLTRAGNGAISVALGQANGSFTLVTPASQVLDLNWKIVGIGDYNGDGRDDLMWRHTSGQSVEWLGIGGGEFANNGALPTVETAWQIQSPDIVLI